MLFGLRFDLRNPSFAGITDSQRYRAAVEMSRWAEERGAAFVTLSEHHGASDGYLPSPVVMAGAIGACTSSIAIAINALIAPFHNPLRLAEDLAVADLIAGGRISVTIAGGYVASEFDMFDVSMSCRPSAVTEIVETLRKAWTGEPFEFRGRTVQVLPRPTNPGGPPISLGGSSEPAARRAARIADGFIPSEPTCWAFYRDECVELGKPDPGPCPVVAADVVVLSEDPEAAWGELGPYFLHENNSYGAWQSSAGIDQTTFPVAADADELRATGQYRILHPDEYSTELAAQGDSAVVLLNPMVGGIPPEMAWNHLRLFEETFL